jgi:hypothetical protein
MPGGTRRRSCLVIVALPVIFGIATPACAWGRLGHRVISRLAEPRLTPAAKAGVAALLAEGETLSSARRAFVRNVVASCHRLA